MPSLKKDKTLRNLQKKGFEPRDGDHVYLNYITVDGMVTGIRTKVSRSSTGDLHSGLVAAMAKQCKLSVHEFEEFAKCTISQQDYERILHAKGFFKQEESPHSSDSK